jgi:cytochrome c
MRVRSAIATLLALVSVHAAADPGEDGRHVYMTQCARCHGQITETHSRGPERIMPAVMAPQGPNLTGVYGRPAGTYAGFRYSDAFRKAADGLVWNDATLDRWIANSQAMVRGSYMFTTVPDARSRQQVIEYLQTYARYRE